MGDKPSPANQSTRIVTAIGDDCADWFG